MNCQRPDKGVGVYRSLEQAGFEGFQFRAVSGCAFREKTQAVILRERLFDAIHRAPDFMTLVSGDEQGARLFCQPADNRPSAYLRFGDEAHGMQLFQGPDVDPGNMVRNEQGPGRLGIRKLPARGNANIQDDEDSSAPLLNAPLALFRRQAGQQECRGGNPVQQMQCEKHQPPQSRRQ